MCNTNFVSCYTDHCPSTLKSTESKFWNECLLLQSALSAQNIMQYGSGYLVMENGYVQVHLQVVYCSKKLVTLLQDNKVRHASKIFQTQSRSGLRIAICDWKQAAIEFMLFTCIDIARIAVGHAVMKSTAETGRVIELKLL